MRLATKLFLVSSLGLFVLAAVGVWSLHRVQHLVEVNGEVVERTAPAMTLQEKLIAKRSRLVRLESHANGASFDAPDFAAWLWAAEGFYLDLEQLCPATAPGVSPAPPCGGLVSAREVALFQRVANTFDRYRDAGMNWQLNSLRTDQLARRLLADLVRLKRATERTLVATQDRARELGTATWSTLSLLLPASLLLCLAGAGVFAHRVTRDLRRLSAATNEVAEGTFTGDLLIRRRDEIGELGAAFRRMFTRLREVDSTKEQFFADISHEFRTPLASIREATSLLRDGVPGPVTPRQARLLEIVSTSSERLLRLVDRILELARIRSRVKIVERRSVDLSRIANRAVDEMRPEAEARRLALRRSGPSSPVVVPGDEEQLLQVMLNLVGNAVKYTPNGGRVAVRLAEADGEAELSVEDDGVGIAPEALPRVFDRFWRAPDSRGGSGLGLAIVKSIVEAHGGSVRGESEVGKGTRFVVRLPRGDGEAR